ncbi:hypothetical protein [Paraburkholderia oxyphila]|uniref:hypothetical protein n=1 Tax=Paraburkholderia oxyphila TaxID=614212 RepID=UPI0012EDB690|nr:hypothetical protein [Paraburkholderia oxyphila]
MRNSDREEIEEIERAFAGDAEAGVALACGIHDEVAALAVELFRAKMPRTAYGPFLNTIWSFGHLNVIKAAKSERTLTAMFRYASYGLEKLPEGDTIRIYRGTSGVDERRAACGYSWTTDRGVAAFFAVVRCGSGKPIVIAADVPRESVLMYGGGRGDGERGEHEVFIRGVPWKISVTGTPEDWCDWVREYRPGISVDLEEILKKRLPEYA